MILKEQCNNFFLKKYFELKELFSEMIWAPTAEYRKTNLWSCFSVLYASGILFRPVLKWNRIILVFTGFCLPWRNQKWFRSPQMEDFLLLMSQEKTITHFDCLSWWCEHGKLSNWSEHTGIKDKLIFCMNSCSV